MRYNNLSVQILDSTGQIQADNLAHLTKIDPNYIQALEMNDFNKLPSATFSKGFIRNMPVLQCIHWLKPMVFNAQA